jgi:D-serine dehydratase
MSARFVWTPLVEKQIPEQAERLGISEEDVVKKVMLKDTVDQKFSEVLDNYGVLSGACLNLFPSSQDLIHLLSVK